MNLVCITLAGILAGTSAGKGVGGWWVGGFLLVSCEGYYQVLEKIHYILM